MVSTNQLSSVPLYPFSLKCQHHSTIIWPPTTSFSIKAATLNCHIPPSAPSPPKVSITQLSYAPLYPLLNQWSAPLNCQMPPPYSFLIKGLHHSTFICPPLPPSPSKFSTTQLSYVLPPSLHFSLKGQHHSTVICPLYPLLPQSSATLHCQIPPSSPFSINCQHHSTVICRPLPPSPSKVSITQLLPPSTPFSIKVSAIQLSYVPLYVLLPQRSPPLNSVIFSPSGQHHSTVTPTSTPFSIKGQHHSFTICPPPCRLLPQSSAPLNCHMSHLYPLLNQRSAPLNCHKSPLYPLLPQSSAPLNCHMSHLYPLLNQRSAPLICHMSPSTPPTPSPSKFSTTQLS